MNRAGTHAHVDSAKKLGKRLRETRTAKGLSQRELAFPGCTPVYICRIEHGDRVPSLQIIRELAARLDVSMEWLAEGDRPLRNGAIEVSQEVFDCLTGKGEDQDRWRIYRLCECDQCEGSGRVEVRDDDDPARPILAKCKSCRGEGKVRQIIATANTEEGVGTALGRLALEGEFLDCPPGLLDTQGEVGEKWLIRPWTASPRNVSDAARVLGGARKGEGP